MAERFVSGFALEAEKLFAVVGSGRDAQSIIDGTGCGEEVSELLEEWAPDDPLSALEALEAICSGELDESRAYEYRRALEIIAECIGERLAGPIDIVMSYYLPNDSHGRWNPVLERLGLAGVAARWAATDLAFPWRDSPSGVKVDWPTATLISPTDARTLRAELDALGSGALSGLEDALFTEDGDASDAGDAREELRVGLEMLAGWLEQASSGGRSLLLMMDGSQ